MVVLKALRTSWRRTKDSKYRLLLQGLLLSRGRRSGAAARAKWNQETYLFCWFRMGETLVTEKAMAPHSSTLAWKITWTEEPGRLQSMGSRRVRHNWVTSLSLFTFMHWRRKWQATHSSSCLENPRDGGTCWAAIYGVAQSRTRLKQLSSSSSRV